jgi:hypothetical protein
MRDNGAYREGIKTLLRIQSELKHRPNRLQVDVLAHSIVEEVGLDKDSRKEYFLKLAKSALLRKEPMYNNFKRRTK